MSSAARPFRVLVSGASGMVGTALVDSLHAPTLGQRPEILRLVRHVPKDPSEIYWDPYERRIDAKQLEGLDAVIHLAGENVGSGDGLLAFTGRWTERKKHHIMESRRRGTDILCRALTSLEQKPPVLVSASGIGYYGNGGERVLDESSPKGHGFMADVADVWETSTSPARDAGIRVVNLRFGAVLSNRGGVIQKLQLPFWLGLGGPVGSGQQFMSWVSLGDAVRAIEYAMRNSDLSGPVNTCSPQPVRNAEFARALGAAMHRPAVIPLPETVVRHGIGEMAEETLLISQRGVPRKLEDSGFHFLHGTIDNAIRAALSPSGGAHARI